MSVSVPSIARVSFSQHGTSGITASLRHTSGPLIAGERIVVFEPDTTTIWGWATVVSFDSDRKVAEVQVDWDSIEEMDSSEAQSIEPLSATAAHQTVVERVREFVAA